MRVYLLRLAALALVLLPGCGGGGVSSGTRATGSATVSIVWPKPTRLIPAAAASIKIEVTLSSRATMTNPPPPSNVIATKVVPRPAAGGTTTVKIEGLPLETVTNTITAFPNADGTGVPQAAAIANLKILEDNSAAVTVTLDSTIDHISLSPNSGQVLSLGSTLAVSAEPRDNIERQVLVLPDGLNWVSTDPTVATVSTKGLKSTVTALKAGNTAITVTEPESMKTASISVTVTGTGGCHLRTDITNPDMAWVGLPPTIDRGVTYTVQLQIGRAFSDAGNTIVGVRLPGSPVNWVIDGVPFVNDQPFAYINTDPPKTHTFSFTVKTELEFCEQKASVSTHAEQRPIITSYVALNGAP